MTATNLRASFEALRIPDLRCAACGTDQFPHVCPGRTRITLAMIGGAL